MNRRRVENGDKFGHLICLDIANGEGDGGNVWRCRCECGVEINVSEPMLISNVIKSCGCIKSRVVDITGQRFGKLTALEPVPERERGGGIRWLCRCDCGTYVTLSSNKLIMKRSRSCGCDRKKRKTYVDGTCVGILLSGTIAINNTSGYRGVYKNGNKWHAYITYSGRRIFLGSHDTKELAAEARQDAEQKIRKHLERLMSNAKEEKNLQACDLYEALINR